MTDKRITGVMIYYYFVCKRKLWYFCHEINMESENENVQLGKLLDEKSYERDEKHINIDNVINIDFIREHQELHEIKKSKAIEEAGIWQVKYYLYYLEKRGVKNIKGKIDYPLMKKSLVVELSEQDREKLKSINTAFINYISQYGITLHFFNYYNFYTGSYYPKESLLAGQLLVKQVEHYTCYDERLVIAKEFIKAAADNIYRNLRYYNSRGKDVAEYMKEVNSLRKKLDHTEFIEELMGIEGNIRKNYYKAWNTIVNQEIQFEKRVMHPPDNMINSLISFVNSLIYAKTLSEIYHTQLDPTISYLHEPGFRRYSLCLDISEVFKPLIGDRLIFSLLNKNQITEKSFTKELNFLHLKKEASRLIVTEFEKRMKQTIMHKELGKKVSYQYLIRLEAYKLIKHLIGEKEYEGFRIWW